MQTAPELIFHDVERSAWVESYILERVQRLDRFADGITSCRVSLTQDQASHRTGNRYSVMVEVRTPPNHDLAARKAKVIREMQTQLPALINLAFGAIERQLKRTAELRRAEVKHQETRDQGQRHGLRRFLAAAGKQDHAWLVRVGRQRPQEFLQRFPQHELAVNATYWIGEAWYGERKYENAILQFQDVIQKYGDHPKVASALLKQGLAFHALGDLKNARVILQKLVDTFPLSEEAKKGKERLAEWKRS